MNDVVTGKDRVGLSFNPSGNEEVDAVKRETARLIDDCLYYCGEADQNPEAARCAEIAAERYEEACMWLVKAITKPVTDE